VNCRRRRWRSAAGRPRSGSVAAIAALASSPPSRSSCHSRSAKCRLAVASGGSVRNGMRSVKARVVLSPAFRASTVRWTPRSKWCTSHVLRSCSVSSRRSVGVSMARMAFHVRERSHSLARKPTKSPWGALRRSGEACPRRQPGRRRAGTGCRGPTATPTATENRAKCCSRCCSRRRRRRGAM